ncbi:acyl-[acyl-carrier-protein]--UDP-N-acetylglucosamine O-acyltransferase [Oleiphilus sp. HI0071]|jgi:UDP-N-acetylglucosamine acyltransferase|nr:acyl-ACP--UDP-N-acetylglucosamine O-acyltransferase [Oleiphilus sp. HI0080]KZY70912.1 acyl-[acyl-carrier-protein]--UDP-N-acetylglucosamine O-acyltransferase [Oleiphilus sp. HI0065]KZY82415.1 acyl-[acyl-carrier-protein]--UDP-N-acetylglucosamine O-acyltransferase [Oleiphilus sp. HI0071]KZZ03841.1 acyl-[acyl-carrier-protein]--UDP-N-acetylglucosamine O-acyltransferase [Oleiphilus sp. HI0073]KZZ40549.1 acyl-[acyl-carrier-protein]--UDP-N-acetylglucosamine O-acyltransferase [Oleiphilus sp. HI0118]
MIHPTAIVDPKAQLGSDVSVGAYTVIGPNVVIGDGCDIRSHVVINGPTTIGKNNTIYQFASVGEECQDKKYAGEDTRLTMGDNNIVREGCTIHRGTVQDEGLTSIGSDNLFMAYVHIAHDCRIGSHCIFANTATVAGHVYVDDFVILGGGTMVHQFCKVGAHAMSAGGSIVLRDIPAFVMASGQSASAYGLNSEGLKRRGFSPESLRALKSAYRTLYRKGLKLDDAMLELKAMDDVDGVIRTFVASIERSDRGLMR